jgi:hypothetical protein
MTLATGIAIADPELTLRDRQGRAVFRGIDRCGNLEKRA